MKGLKGQEQQAGTLVRSTELLTQQRDTGAKPEPDALNTGLFPQKKQAKLIQPQQHADADAARSVSRGLSSPRRAQAQSSTQFQNALANPIPRSKARTTHI